MYSLAHVYIRSQCMYSLAHVCILSPMYVFARLCMYLLAHVCLRLPMSVFACPCIYSLAHVCNRSEDFLKHASQILQIKDIQDWHNISMTFNLLILYLVISLSLSFSLSLSLSLYLFNLSSLKNKNNETLYFKKHMKNRVVVQSRMTCRWSRTTSRGDWLTDTCTDNTRLTNRQL